MRYIAFLLALVLGTACMPAIPAYPGDPTPDYVNHPPQSSPLKNIKDTVWSGRTILEGENDLQVRITFARHMYYDEEIKQWAAYCWVTSRVDSSEGMYLFSSQACRVYEYNNITYTIEIIVVVDSEQTETLVNTAKYYFTPSNEWLEISDNIQLKVEQVF